MQFKHRLFAIGFLCAPTLTETRGGVYDALPEALPLHVKSAAEAFLASTVCAYLVLDILRDSSKMALSTQELTTYMKEKFALEVVEKLLKGLSIGALVYLSLIVNHRIKLLRWPFIVFKELAVAAAISILVRFWDYWLWNTPFAENRLEAYLQGLFHFALIPYGLYLWLLKRRGFLR